MVKTVSALAIYLERVKVIDDTDDPGVDEMYAVASSRGRIVQDPRERRWPTSGDVEIRVGEYAPSNPIEFARIEPDRNGKVDFATVITVWESDINDVDAALRLTVDEAVKLGKGALPAPPGTGGLISAAAAFLEALVNALLDLIGFKDDLMAVIPISYQGELTSAKSLEDYQWAPPWPADRLEQVTPDALRFKVLATAHGGVWEIWILAQRIYDETGEDAGPGGADEAPGSGTPGTPADGTPGAAPAGGKPPGKAAGVAKPPGKQGGGGKKVQ